MLASFLSISKNSHFTMQNIPFGVGRLTSKRTSICSTRIGDHIIDLKSLEAQGMFSDIYKGKIFTKDSLNAFMAKDRSVWKKVRTRIQELFSVQNAGKLDSSNVAIISAENFISVLPAKINSFVDFYSCYHHAYNCGVMFRGVINALSPNWLHMPIAYNGRASTVQVSHDVKRPSGQVFLKENNAPVLSPSKALDYEVEIGFFLGGSPNSIGSPIAASNALDNVFGLVLLNDWSARDLQLWEMQPLGPFTSKSFLTTISPWIVTLEALEPFMVPMASQSPKPLDYLQGDFSVYDIDLFTSLQTAKSPSQIISKANAKYLYWTVSQQIAHLTVSGCRIEPGDLFGSGTISGPNEGSGGCLLEITKNLATPLILNTGETRGYLEDGDRVTLEAYVGKNEISLGFGSTSSVVLP